MSASDSSLALKKASEAEAGWPLQPCLFRQAFHIYDFTTTNEPLVWQGSQIHGFSKGLLSPVLNLTATHIKSFGNLGSTQKIIWAILYKKGLVQRTVPVTSWREGV